MGAVAVTPTPGARPTRTAHRLRYRADMARDSRRSRRGRARSVPPGPSPREPRLEPVDPVAAVRATSSGFTVLFLGLLLAPVLGVFVAGSTAYAELLACVAAGAVAGSRIGSARLGHLQGALGASSAYLLVLPLMLLFPLGRDIERNLSYLLTIAAVGAVAGFLAARRRDAPTAG